MGSEINHIEPIIYKKVEKRAKQKKKVGILPDGETCWKKYTGSRDDDSSSKNTVLF